MGNALAYGGIITKVKAMSSHLVTPKDYEHIASLETTADFINFLRTKPSYNLIFKDVNETTIHRGQIEELIKISLLMDFQRIYTFATREQRKFLDIFFFRYEVNILKDCLEQIYNQKSTLHLADFQPFFEKHSVLNLNTLAGCTSLDEFIVGLEGSRYYNLFLTLHNSMENVSLSDYETQLDIYFFQQIWKTINKQFKGKEKKRMLSLFGTQIDMLNIMWVYRSKKFYTVDAKEIYLSIIPIHFHLTKEQLIRLVEAAGTSEFLLAISNTHYHNIIQPGNKQTIEYTTFFSMNHLYKKLTSESSHSMLHILYYLFLKEKELDFVTTALECIRYHLEPNETLKYIYIT
ncbi:V0D/AC39 family V-type ATPase subunit [[Clostridium] polysaccharolyticum]|uniref:V/A-type H+-transporting ATPase subunit C n=1 Tax=[Clostridium] polysaccharolyticum TaxID=29364 RepID=A0A1I0D6G0_9FIRM|nr:V-type ATPase subunit [[Clostridium] polysaccharolyticum]SET27859.1 V/A-type H+-transporting ATPase subunit C [[Clostridium] polysaccharolyticum]